MQPKKHYKKIYTNAEFLNRSEARQKKHEESLPEKKSFDRLELEARCELTKPNFNRASPEKQRAIRARAMSRNLGRWIPRG